jgi:hypothetical protein
MTRPSRPRGMTLLALFFAFGTTMCVLTTALLVFPGSCLDVVWRVNPQARAAFGGMGDWAVLLMVCVGAACAAAGLGLYRGASWGRTVAVLVLSCNLVGDVANVFLRHDFRALIGLPIGGLFIGYLVGRTASSYFAAGKR